METARRGNAAEAAVLAALIERGFDVLVPFGGGHPYDLVVEVGEGRFVRVQCKAGWPSRGCILFNCRGTDHGNGPLSYAGLAEAFGVYFPPNRRVYLVPIGDVGNHEGRLRLEPARNNQRRRTRRAADFEIERWTREQLAALVA